MSGSSSIHVPVMLREVVETLQIRSGGVWVDLGCGPGGYTAELLRRCAPDGRVIALDVDEDALALARRNLASFPPERISLVRANFAELASVLSEAGVTTVNGCVLDAGFSRDQVLGDQSRGLSFLKDEPLDMRLDRTLKTTAADLVNTLEQRELAALFRDFGQERQAGRIAAAIVRRRRQRPIRTTLELAELITATVSPRPRGNRVRHAATKAFMALRTAVNDELSALRAGIEQAVLALQPGSGRMVVVSYDSNEDGLTKRTFRDLERGCRCPASLPTCVCGRRPEVRVLTKKPVRPSREEIAANPSARSARLRAVERLPEVKTDADGAASL